MTDLREALEALLDEWEDVCAHNREALAREVSLVRQPPSLERFRALVAAHPEPTKPSRDTVRDEIAGHPIGSGYYGTTVSTGEAGEIADAILALLPGRTEAQIKAEALYDLAAHMETLPAGTRTIHDPATIRAYADRNHPRKDQQ